MFQELVTNITNTSVFTDSFKDWIANLSINSIFIFIMMIFMIVGAVDKIRGNKKGYGEQFGKAGGHGPARAIAARDNVAVFHVQGDHDVKAEGMCRRRQEVEERFHCCAFERTVLNELTEQSGEHNDEGVDHNRCKAFPILCL